jgi:hypothetical protein
MQIKTTPATTTPSKPPRDIETYSLRWQNIDLEVTWERNWLNIGREGDRDVAHLVIQSVNPLDAPLPITGTGYRSHFTNEQTVMALGGPVAFVEAWLEAESQLPDWHDAEAARQQLTLF